MATRLNARAVEIIRTAIDRLKNKLGSEALQAAEQAQPTLGKAATAYEKAAAPFLESSGEAQDHRRACRDAL